MEAQTIVYKQRRRSMLLHIGHVYAYLLGMFAGGIAYLHGAPLFILGWFNWEKVADVSWAFFVAILSGIGGMIGKMIFDSYLKKIFQKWIKAIKPKGLKKKQHNRK